MGPDESPPVGSPTAPESPPDPPVDAVLRRRLRSAADPDGFLPFDRFMEIALYDPGRGFYNRGSTRLGRAGDFYTAAHVHGLFGATLAAHFREVRKSSGFPAPFPVVEVGAGDGTLADDIRKALERTSLGGGGWELVLVERSEALRTEIERKLGPSARSKVPWRFAHSLAAEGPFRGILLANELLDAFPFRRFLKQSNGWAELGVGVSLEGPLRTETRPPELTDAPADLSSEAPVGAVLEVSPTMEAWVREIADHFVGGRAILIDYGEDEATLVQRGGAGTLEAIRDHRVVDPLSRPGTADLSSWVNFTRVRRAAAAAGLREVFYGPFAEAMVRWGVDSVRSEWAATVDSVEAVKLQLAQKSFLLNFGTFKVLELSAGGSSS